MSLPSILKTAFDSYLDTAPADIKTCIDVSSMWKKPSMYWFTAYYCTTTNQIIWTGKVIPYYDEEPSDVFMTFEGGDAITVGELLINLLEILSDESNLVMNPDERGDLLEKFVIDLNNEPIVINN